MKKKSLTLCVAVALAGSMTFTSCIGSFGLTNKLLSWNQSINSKFVNEVVFIVFHIIPVYEISCLADILILNSIEFWSGSNPVADAGQVQTIQTENGTYMVETQTDGYHIEKEGDKDSAVDLVYNDAEKTWSVEANGEAYKLMKFTGEQDVVMYLPDGQSMNVELSQAGVMAFQQVAQNYGYYAAR